MVLKQETRNEKAKILERELKAGQRYLFRFSDGEELEAEYTDWMFWDEDGPVFEIAKIRDLDGGRFDGKDKLLVEVADVTEFEAA